MGEPMATAKSSSRVVAESAAIGKPDAAMMEVVKAFVALKPGYEPSRKLEMEIMNFMRDLEDAPPEEEASAAAAGVTVSAPPAFRRKA